MRESDHQILGWKIQIDKMNCFRNERDVKWKFDEEIKNGK